MTAELRHGDWRDPASGLLAMGAGAVDHLIADPPYSKHVHKNCRTLGRSGGVVDLGFDHFDDTDRDTFCGVAGRVVRRWVIVHCDLESVGAWQAALEANAIEHIRTGVWIKLGATPQLTGDRPGSGAEAIVIGHVRKPNGKPAKKRWNGGGRPAVYRMPAPPSSKDRHPTQKPLELLERLILDFTDHGDKVADTHAGAGTTLVAAVRCGRRAVGWELQDRWVRVARRRLAVTHEQLDFTDAGQMRARSDAQIALGD